MDRRIARTERSIQEAFLAQRAEKPLEKIRVRELCEAAQIHKSTFYAHYPDVYALADAMESQLVEEILARVGPIRAEDLRSRPEWLTRELSRAFVAHDRQVKILFSGSRQGALVDRERLMDILWPQSAPANATSLLHTSLYSIRKSLAPYGLDQLLGTANTEMQRRFWNAMQAQSVMRWWRQLARLSFMTRRISSMSPSDSFS